jgi:hypothetical protein
MLQYEKNKAKQEHRRVASNGQMGYLPAASNNYSNDTFKNKRSSKKSFSQIQPHYGPVEQQ